MGIFRRDRISLYFRTNVSLAHNPKMSKGFCAKFQLLCKIGNVPSSFSRDRSKMNYCTQVIVSGVIVIKNHLRICCIGACAKLPCSFAAVRSRHCKWKLQITNAKRYKQFLINTVLLIIRWRNSCFKYLFKTVLLNRLLMSLIINEGTCLRFYTFQLNV